MKRLLCSDELPERVRLAFIICLNPRARGQDKANPAFWLATRVGEMGPFCPLGILRVGPARKTSLFGHIINPLFTKLVLALFAFLSTSRTRLISSHLDLAQFYIKSKIFSVLQVIDSATLLSLKVRCSFQFLWNVCNGPYFTSHDSCA